MKRSEIISVIEKTALPASAAQWDRSGIQVAGHDAEATALAVCLDPTPAAVVAALDLGAPPIYAFFKVVFPDIMPGVLSGFLLAFTMSLDDFIITHFTKGAGINTLSTLIYSEVRRGIRPSMYALSSIIFLTVLILLIFVNFRSIKKPEHA